MDPFEKPVGSPLGAGVLGDLLRRELKVGEEASVLNEGYPHEGHIDATLYQKFPNGQIYPTSKIHLNPETLTEK